MHPTFTLEELQINEDSEEGQIHSRKIFEVIKEKAKKDGYLSEYEKDFFCRRVLFSGYDDGTWDDYSCCDNVKFKFLYLVYYRDFTGGSSYYKPLGLEIVKAKVQEVKSDLDYIYGKANEWEEILKKGNHKDQLLYQIAIEARNEIKNLNKRPEFINDLSHNSDSYIAQFRSILLHSRFLYFTALEIYEILFSDDLLINLNGKIIEFNEYSLIHILNRHFAAVVKHPDIGKSFHNDNFAPRILPLQLKQLIEIIDESKILDGKSINKIVFMFKNINYVVYIGEMKKSIKGKGLVSYLRLNTFYPILEEIRDNFKLIKLNDDLSVYIYN